MATLEESKQVKTCILCNESRPLNAFHKKSDNRDGLDNRCSSCKSSRRRARYKENKEYEDSRNLKWMDRNREKFREYNKLYYQNNKDKFAARTASRRAQKLKASVEWSDKQYINDLYESCREFESILQSMGVVEKFNVDHEIPLKHKKVCGLHCEYNLQVITAHENFTKNNSFTNYA